MHFSWDASVVKPCWEQPDGEVHQVTDYVEGVLRTDSRTDVKFDHRFIEVMVEALEMNAIVRTEHTKRDLKHGGRKYLYSIKKEEKENEAYP